LPILQIKLEALKKEKKILQHKLKTKMKYTLNCADHLKILARKI